MKTKKRLFGVLVASLLVSLSLLCFGITGLVAKAEETSVSTVDSSISETVEAPTTEPDDNFNNKIESLLGTIFGASGVALDAVLLGLLSIKKKEPVSVTVNDSETQTKLQAIQDENNKLHSIVVSMFQLQKGTFEILKTIFANNSGLNDTVRETIHKIAEQEESVVKDFEEILGAETHKKVKTTLNNISNIILG